MHYFASREDIEKLQQAIECLQEEVRKMATGLAALQTEQAALTASIAQNSTVVGSVVTLLNGLSTQLANVSAQLAATGSEDPAVLAAAQSITNLRTTLDKNTQSLSAAVVADTPAATQPAGPPSMPVVQPA